MEKDTFFRKCHDAWKQNKGEAFWEDIAKEFGLSKEAARNRFRRERKRRNLTKETEFSAPKIVIFDIETAPMKLELNSWRVFDVHTNSSHIKEFGYMLCWRAKTLNDSKIVGDIVNPTEARTRNDKSVVQKLWEYLNDADIVIGHNIKGFDLKEANTRFLYYNLPPLSNKGYVDTYSVAKNHFNFPSNSLKSINKMLGITMKMENEGFPLWEKCMSGDKEALKTMWDYCGQDILAEEDLYYRMRPFIKNHPNLSLYSEIEERMCPTCSSLSLTNCGYYYTQSGKYQSYRCDECGATHRASKTLISKGKKILK